MRGDTGFPVRIRYSKLGRVRFVGHRDIARAFERAFRVERWPLAFTEGFAPRPKVSFGLALSVGHESDAEYLDVELARSLDVTDACSGLDAALPDGVQVTGAAPLEARAPALQEAVSCVGWRIEVLGPEGESVEPDAVQALVDAVFAAETLPLARERKGHTQVDDVRPALRAASVRTGAAGGVDPQDRVGGATVVLDAETSTHPVGIRPAELIAVLGGALTCGRVRRTNQWIERGGARLEPLEADAPRAEQARAS